MLSSDMQPPRSRQGRRRRRPDPPRRHPAPPPAASGSYEQGPYEHDPHGAGQQQSGHDPQGRGPGGYDPQGRGPYPPDPNTPDPNTPGLYGPDPYGEPPRRRDPYQGSSGMGQDLDRAFVGASRSRRLFRAMVVIVVGLILLAGIAAFGFLLFGSPGGKGGLAAPRNDPGPKSSPQGHADAAPGTPPVITPRRAPYIPAVGTGRFVRPAAGTSRVYGRGKVMRYMIEVEGGIRQQPLVFARSVEKILADPRGWTAGGRWGFKRVDSGTYDFVVRLASPGTVDKLCGAYGLETNGQVNCSGGKQVVVNLRRWLLLTTYYRQQPDQYHALVINHEVGHRLGYNHMTCGRKGRLAPVMQQQIFGLKGCLANGWPYDRRGRFITGPGVP
ncbi:DUF3152 domain-containing protein [Actinomadura sp. 6N118]|uniref:DUF3152 domain-containing protein n=1 Tax=Actinomadura sp. 6N118 TaxID=3375151 RepID=UPI003787F7FD